jgi:hypothetical protein
MSYAQWNPQANYLVGDTVYDGATVYVAVAPNTAKQPSLNTPLVWNTLSTAPATPTAQYYKTSTQVISSFGAPQTTVISWQAAKSFSDTARISQLSPTTFQVNQQGVYFFDAQLTITLGAGYAATDPTRTFRMTLQRGGLTNGIFQQTWEQGNTAPNQYAVSLSGTYECLAGDILAFQTQTYMNAGSYTIEDPFNPPGDWDLNTYWAWSLIKPTP